MKKAQNHMEAKAKQDKKNKRIKNDAKEQKDKYLKEYKNQKRLLLQIILITYTSNSAFTQ